MPMSPIGNCAAVLYVVIEFFQFLYSLIINIIVYVTINVYRLAIQLTICMRGDRL